MSTGSAATIPTALSPRRRAALRLDLEDRQATLILELYSLSLRHGGTAAGHASLPDWRVELSAPRVRWSGDQASGPPLVALHGRLERLYQVNQALARLAAGAYGRCHHCGQDIAFAVLAGDPVRLLCTVCTP